MDGRAVVRLFDCTGKMCGRILWLKVPRDLEGQLDRDKNNPKLRNRQLCGLTILWILQPTTQYHWEGGWCYNSDDGTKYRVKAQLESGDTIIARIDLGIPLFGQSKTVARVPRGTSPGWC